VKTAKEIAKRQLNLQLRLNRKLKIRNKPTESNLQCGTNSGRRVLKTTNQSKLNDDIDNILG